MKKINQRSFTLFAINYIVGFGFITTITSLVKIGIFGLVVFLLTSTVNLSLSLVFARLSNKFNNKYGGSYLFAKKVFNSQLSFFYWMKLIYTRTNFIINCSIIFSRCYKLFSKYKLKHYYIIKLLTIY